MTRLLLATVLSLLAAPVPPLAAAGPQCLPPALTVIPEVPWAQRLLQPQRVWPLTRGAGVTVAVLDTGVDAGVPQLLGRVGGVTGDCGGHGTFVAGIVAAAPATGVGFAGMAPDARVLSIQVTRNAAERTPPGPLAAAVRSAADQGAEVIVVAVPIVRAGTELREAVAAATARDSLVVVPATAPAQGDPPPDPELLAMVLSVGGLDAQGAAVADTAGPADLLAPGADVVSVGPRGPGHLSAGGTGYAVPFAAGAAALVRAYHPHLTAAQVKRRLTLTASTAGGGLDPYAAVTTVLPEERATPRPPVAQPGDRAAIGAPSAVDGRAVSLAWYAVLAAGLALAGSGALAVLAPRGRRRRWRAGAR